MARQLSMIAFNRDEIGGCRAPRICPFAAEARLTLVLGETVFLRPVATRTFCQADLQESETFGPGSSYEFAGRSARLITALVLGLERATQSHVEKW